MSKQWVAKRPKSIPRAFLYGMCMKVVTVVALEMAVRIWGYSERNIYDPIYTSFDRTEDIPYVHKPNLMEARARGLAVINTDSLGLRAKTAGATYGIKRSNEYRIGIAIVGDSCTFGEGIARTEDTFAQVLEDILNQRQQAVNSKVCNYGASAYSVEEMAAALTFLELNVVETEISNPALVATVLAVAQGETEKSAIAAFSRKHAKS